MKQSDFLDLCSSKSKASIEHLKKIKSDSKATAKVRLEIYRHAYFHKLLSTMEDDFPVCAAILGEATFANHVRSYLSAFTPNTESLVNIGEKFSCYLKTTTAVPLSIIELSIFEWELAKLEYSDESIRDSLDPSTFIERDLGSIRLNTAQTLKVLSFNWPVHDIYKMEKILPTKKSEICLFLSKKRSPQYLALNDMELELIKAAQKAESLDSVLSLIIDKGALDRDFKDFIDNLTRLINSNIIVIESF